MQLIPLGRSPSLHSLRTCFHSFVRELRRYYATVRLPIIVHHWLASLDFPMRSTAPSLPMDNYGLSQFSRKMLRCMFRVFDLVEPAYSRAFEYDRVAFRFAHRVGTPVLVFRGSIPDLLLPLSTLHRYDCSYRCMTRGQLGSLLLSYKGLSPSTSYRFILAHGRRLSENCSRRRR